MKSLAVVAFMLLCVLSVGCVQHLGNFTALSTSNYEGTNINKAHLVNKNATGKTMVPMILGIPIAIPKVDQAVAEALSKNEGDFLTNARLYYTWWTAILYGEMGYKVEGESYRTRD